ncbi:MAG TPA: glycosyltransferase family 39 protein [Mycobacteriales bacterium]|jgi:hypothetical protein
MRALLGALLVLAAGHGVVRVAAPRRAFGVVGGAAFGWLAGTAALGLLTTLLATLGLPSGPGVLLVPLLALAAVGAARTRPALRVPSPAGAGVAVVGTWLLATAAHGRVLLNDEYAIWGLRGRALRLAGGLDERLFANAAALYQHLDYPLLVPATIAWSDGVAGRTADGAAHAYVAAFAVALLGVVAWAGEELAGRAAALVAVLLVVTVDKFSVNALRLLADLPVAAFALATVVLLLAWLRDGDAGALRLSAVMAAGAWATKNEGGLYVLAAVVATAVAARVARRRVLAPLAVGAVALAANLPWAVWTRAHGITNDVVNAGTHVGPGRAGTVARGLVTAWPGTVAVTLLAAVAAYVAVRRGHAARAVAALGALALTTGGIAATYLVTPYDIDWHLRSSADRVLLYPALLAAFAVPVLLGGAGTMPGGSDEPGTREGDGRERSRRRDGRRRFPGVPLLRTPPR